MWMSPVLVILLLLCAAVSSVDHYRILGVGRGAGDREIKKAYHKLALKYHPDKNDSPNAGTVAGPSLRIERSMLAQLTFGRAVAPAERFAKIANAYETLSDSEKKRKYDLYGDEDENRQRQQQQQQRWGQRQYQGGGSRMHFDFGGYQQQQQQQPIDSATESMTVENWNELTKGDKVWMVQFYSDRSQACRTFSDAWEASAEQLNGYVHYGRVNVFDSSRLYKRYGMEGTPSLMLFADGRAIVKVAERPADRWGAGGPLSAQEVTKMALEHFPDAMERLPADLRWPTVQLVKAWLFGEGKMAKDRLQGNMPSLLLLRDTQSIKKSERIMLRFLARTFRKYVRVLLVDVGASQCRKQGSQCNADLALIKKEWTAPNTMVKEQGSPVVNIPSGTVKEMRKAIKEAMSLHVPELTSRTIEHLAPHELQRRVSKPASRVVMLLGRRGGIEAPSFPPQGFTEVMHDPLQHNLAQLRQVVRRVHVGKMGKEILGSDPPPQFMWVDREKQTDLAEALDRAAGGEVLLAYFEGRLLKTLTKAQALEERHADADGKFTTGLPPASTPGLLKWLRSARQGLKPIVLTDAEGSKRDFGSGKSWVVDDDGPGLIRRLLELLRLDKSVDVAMDFLLMLDQSQVFLLCLLLAVGYSISGVASSLEGDEYAQRRGASSSRNPRNLPGRPDTRYYSEEPEHESSTEVEETENQAATEATTGALSRDRGVSATTRAVRAMASGGRPADTVVAEAAVELATNNVTELLGRDRRKPLSLQLFIFRRDSEAAMGQFLSLAEDWCAQFRCCWVDCASEPAWSSFCKRLAKMDSPAAAGSDRVEGTREPEVELVLWRKGGLQCARFSGSEQTSEAWDQWIRGVRMGDVKPSWHTLRADGETELPHWPSFAADVHEGSDDGDASTSGNDSEDSV